MAHPSGVQGGLPPWLGQRDHRSIQHRLVRLGWVGLGLNRPKGQIVSGTSCHNIRIGTSCHYVSTGFELSRGPVVGDELSGDELT